jgi:uncharacterized protein (TIGR02246 family)
MKTADYAATTLANTGCAMPYESLSPLLQALSSRDAELIASFFAPDAKLFSENFTVKDGSSAIKESLSRRFKENPGVEIRILGKPEIRMVTDDVAVIECDFQTTGSATAPSEGRSVSVAKRKGDAWLIDSHWMISK